MSEQNCPDLRDDLTEVHNHVLSELRNGVAVGSYCDQSSNRKALETLLKQSLEYGGKEHSNTQTITTPVMYHMLALRDHQHLSWGSGQTDRLCTPIPGETRRRIREYQIWKPGYGQVKE